MAEALAGRFAVEERACFGGPLDLEVGEDEVPSGSIIEREDRRAPGTPARLGRLSGLVDRRRFIRDSVDSDWRIMNREGRATIADAASSIHVRGFTVGIGLDG